MSQILAQLFRQAGCPVSLLSDELRDLVIHSVAIDSRRVKPGCLFLALKGEKEDGFSYAEKAVALGAAAILYEGGLRPEAKALPIPTMPILGLRAFASPLLHAAHGLPGKALLNVGITGTNGKTTVTKLCAALLEGMGHRVIRLGTIDYAYAGTVIPSSLTTPGPDQFFEILETGVAKGCTALAMEVSSHALSQDRIRGLQFQRALFTNLTQDHLDFHAGFEDYFQAKAKLFEPEYLTDDGFAILNADSEYGVRLKASLSNRGMNRILTFTRHSNGAEVTVQSSELKLSGTRLSVSFQGRTFEVVSALVGAINIENLLAAVTFGLSMGLNGDAIATALKSVTVPGRNELLPLPNGAFAVVDYAHTPDALDRVLKSLRSLTPGRLHCVFGCGGDRDKTKRPIMGEIAAKWADTVLITSDNPRTENADSILANIVAGIPSGHAFEIIPDRRSCILRALVQAQNGDCVLIAGKGHEDYQIIGTTKYPFSDQNIVREFTSGQPGVAWK